MKWNALQNGSGDSPEAKCLGKFASACLKVDWNTALDELAQVCLIRDGAKLCRALALQDLVWRPLSYRVVTLHMLFDHYK